MHDMHLILNDVQGFFYFTIGTTVANWVGIIICQES